MRVIIIEDKDAMALIDSLKLEKFEDARLMTGSAFDRLSESSKKSILDSVHRRFHFIVTRWLQEQGARGLR